MDVPQLVYTFPYWRIFYLLPAFEARCPCLGLWLLRKWPKDTRSIQINSDDTISIIQWPLEVAPFCRLVNELCLTLWDPMDGSPPDFSVHGILAGKNTGAVYHFLLQGIFQTQRSTHVFCISRQIPYHWAAWEAPCINCLSLHIALPRFVFPFTSWRTCVVVFFLSCFSVFGYQRPNCYELYVHIFVWMFVFNSYTFVWNVWATW